MIEINVKNPLVDRVSLSVSLKRARFVLDERGGGEICAWNVDTEASRGVSALRS